MPRSRSALILIAALLVVTAFAAPAAAEVFHLHSGGTVHGELVNRDQSPRKQYVVKTASGGEVTIPADQVKKVARQNPAEVKYDQIRSTYPDTVDGQWKLAEWCRQNKLIKARHAHLERIIELDPNHAEARHGLGYSQIQGRWVTQETLMTENGYVRYKGAWLLPQEIELKEQEEKEKHAQLQWRSKLKRWHGWLSTDKAAEAIASIKAIDDPYASGALAQHLNNPKEQAAPAVRLLYVEALGRLQAAAGMDALVTASLYDADNEVRLSSLEQIVDKKYMPAVPQYVKALKSKDNAIINRAAIGLGRMKDQSAVVPLIDALVTVHTFQVQKGGGPGQMNSSFNTTPGAGGGGGGGFTFGGSNVETVKQELQNSEVLQALVDLTGTSFNFEKTTWKKWYAAQKKPATLDARRDGASQ